MAARQERGDDSGEAGKEGQEHEGRVGASGGTPALDIRLAGIAKGPINTAQGSFRTAGVDELIIEKVPSVVAVGSFNGDRKNLAPMMLKNKTPIYKNLELLTIPPARRARLVTPSRTHVIIPSRESMNKEAIPSSDARIPRAPVKMA